MRVAIPVEYTDPLEVPTQFLGPEGIPTLGWLAYRASTVVLTEDEQHILHDAALGVTIAETSEEMGLSHDRIELRRSNITSLLLGTSILHTVRIGLESGIIPVEKLKPGQTIPSVQGENQETFDLLSRGYTAQQVGELQGIRTASVHSRMKPVYKALKTHGIIPTTTRGYQTGLLQRLSSRERLPEDDPILSQFI